jgi:predicted kinase
METMRKATPFDIGAAVAAVKSGLDVPPPARGQPALVMLAGLPGTGKSTLARRLAEALPAVIIESDRVRQTLFDPPGYGAEESRRVHLVCHILMGWYLRHYYHVVYDATNLYEYHRQLVYRLAERSGARLVVAEVTASQEVVRQRLAPRRREPSSPPSQENYSDADWDVYVTMRRRAEPIQRQHLRLDTSQGDLDSAIQELRAAVGSH